MTNTMRPHRAGDAPNSSRFAWLYSRQRAALLVLGLAFACGGDVTEPVSVHSRIALDVRALTGAHAALGDGASIAAMVELIAFLDDSPVLVLSQSLTPTDTIAAFDIELEPETYTFAVYVFSNKQVLIFAGGTTASIARNGFQIEIGVEPLTAVMVVSPRETTVQQGLRGTTILESTLLVRNVGRQTLNWSFSCNPECSTLQPQSGLVPGATAPAPIAFFGTGTWQVTFDSEQGSVTVSVTVTQ